jgi:alkanesulfonate monooxygenase SsuD/methylene tetrahydromethanopterin reductase-like flavin-dependent oxidoreductase (luciferase family)
VTRLLDGRHHLERFAMEQAGEVDYLMPPAVLTPPPPSGAGERKTLALAARHADIWNALLPDAESYERKSRLLDEHCARIGRDPGTIERSVLVASPPENLGEQHLALGASLFIVMMNPSDSLAEVERWVAWRDRRKA